MIDTPEQLEQAAIEAERLRTDPAFQRAALAIRKDALEALASCNPEDASTIRNNQALVRAIDGLCGEIANAIMRAPRKTLTVV